MLTAYTDGSFSHQGEMGAGLVVYQGDTLLFRVSYHLGRNGGKASSNYAEYAAVWELLEELESLPDGPITVYCDSNLLVRQLKGMMDINGGAYADFARRVKARVKTLERKIKFIWIPRKENTEADALSKEAHVHRGRMKVAP
jgi:ribonuclease HI